MSSGVIQCDGDVLVSMDGAPLCSGTWTLVPVPEPFDVSQLDPAVLGQAWLVGFTLVGTCWFAGKACRLLLSMIR